MMVEVVELQKEGARKGAMHFVVQIDGVSVLATAQGTERDRLFAMAFAKGARAGLDHAEREKVRL